MLHIKTPEWLGNELALYPTITILFHQSGNEFAPQAQIRNVRECSSIIWWFFEQF